MSGWVERRAMKDHRCNFCNATIAAGDTYSHIRLTPWDHPDNDGFFTWRAHPFCVEVWQSHAGPMWDWEWCDDPWEWANMVEDYAPDRVAEYPFDRDCGECDGSGTDPEQEDGRCRRCDGTGSRYKRQRTTVEAP